MRAGIKASNIVKQEILSFQKLLEDGKGAFTEQDCTVSLFAARDRTHGDQSFFVVKQSFFPIFVSSSCSLPVAC